MRRGFLQILAVLTALVGVRSVNAQTTPGGAADLALGEIVVTAQRRTENLQDVPVAVTALTAAELTSSGIVGTMDLPTVTPGLTMPQSSGYVTPHIRGVGTSAFGAGLENSVATYIDGVYLASAPSSIMKLADIASVEVLKGPQGTLFGRNATGGLIQIETKDPTPGFGGEASVSYGNFKSSEASAYLTGGPSDRLAADLSLLASFQGEGYGRNLFNGEDANKDTRNIAARSKWLIRPDDNSTLRIAIDYSEDYGNLYESPQIAPGTKPLYGPGSSGSPWDINSDFQPYDDYKGGGVSGRLDYDFGAVKFVDIAAYRKSRYAIGFDADLTTLPIETINPLLDRETQLSDEVQLLSNTDGRVSWVAGLYYFNAKGGYYPSEVSLGGPAEIPLGPPPAPSIDEIQIIGDQTTRSFAGYGQATAEIADKTKLELGFRYTYERRQLNAQELGFVGSGVGIGGLIPPIVGEEVSSSAPTWRLALDRQFTDDILGYVSYNRGFKSGGFNVGVPTDPAFKPERLDAYEVGLKTDLDDHRLRINSAAYFYNYSDIQVSHYVLGQIGYYNGAKAQLYGIDVDAEAQITRELRLRGGLALNHSEFTSFPNALIATPLPGGGSAIETGSATGNELPFSPRGSANLAIDYRIRIASAICDLDVTDYYSAGWFAAPDNILRQPAYNLVNASLSLSTADERRSLRLWGRNLSNAAVATGLDSSALSDLVQYQPPRTYGVTLAVKF
jgi:iron complex outermembrane recepter protein